MKCPNCKADLEEVGATVDLNSMNCSIKDGFVEVIIGEVGIDSVLCGNCEEYIDIEMKLVDYEGKEVE